jgi:hypothetical protein
MKTQYDRCLIVKHTFNGHTWYLVQQNCTVLSRPFGSFTEAISWLKGILDDTQLGCARITDDLTEVYFKQE